MFILEKISHLTEGVTSFVVTKHDFGMVLYTDTVCSFCNCNKNFHFLQVLHLSVARSFKSIPAAHLPGCLWSVNDYDIDVNAFIKKPIKQPGSDT